MAVEFLEGEYGPGEAQEAAEYVTDKLAILGTGLTMELKWSVQSAIADAFGFDVDDDGDFVYREGTQ